MGEPLPRRRFLAGLAGGVGVGFLGTTVARAAGGVTLHDGESVVVDCLADPTASPSPTATAEPSPEPSPEPTGATLVSGDHPDGFTVPEGETWQIDGLVTTPRNVVVAGTLVMRSGSTLRFRDVDESAFVGGHVEEPLASDVGLWLVGNGVLDAVGSAKLPWTRMDRPASAGDTVLHLPAAPSGWQAGDEIVVAATAPGRKAWNHFDRVRIAAVDGAAVTLDQPLTFDHPVFTHASITQVFGPEVVNLTRDCKIEGTPGGKSHVVALRTAQPQTVSYVELSHLGPEKPTGDDYKRAPIFAPVGGRYAWHWHLCGDAARGSVMTGLSAHDLGAQGFVTHETNGVDWVECVAHDSTAPQFWWDRRKSTRDEHPPSHDVRYLRCVGSYRWTYRPVGPQWREAIFELLEGTGNAAVGCVATSAYGAGFHWPEGSQGVWDFRDCVAHNNRDGGMTSWQNSRRRHIVDRFLIFRCGSGEGGGIEHGAYSNRYLYSNGLIAEIDGAAPLGIHAANRSETFDLEFRNVFFDSQWESCVEGRFHRSTRPPVLYNDCTFTGYADHAMRHVRSSEAPMRAVVDRYRADDARLSVISPDNVALGSFHDFRDSGNGADLSMLSFPTP